MGVAAVRQWRSATARTEKDAARKAAHEAAKRGYANGDTIPPQPIPADVVALALLHLPKWAKEPEVNRMVGRCRLTPGLHS